jgi:purine-binding chemotaxis protein CheW
VSTLYVVFKVADAEYALAASDVLLMETFTGATRVPGTERHVIGLVQIRGQVVPVVDLRARFGLPPIATTLDSRVVVVSHEGRSVGLLVDSAREVVKLSADQFHPPPDVVSEQSGGVVTSVAQAGPRLVMLIDFGKVIGEENLHED